MKRRINFQQLRLMRNPAEKEKNHLGEKHLNHIMVKTRVIRISGFQQDWPGPL